MTNVVPFGRKPDPASDGPVEVTRPGHGSAVEIRASDDLAPMDTSTIQHARPPVITGTVTGAAGVHPGELRPIVPGWMRSWTSIKLVARWWLRMQWHHVRFHAFRLPDYARRVVVRAPRGVWRLTSSLVRWAFDTRADGLEQQLASGMKQDSIEFRKLREDRARRVRARLMGVAVFGVLGLAAVVGAWAVAPAPVRVLAGVILCGVFARIGSNPGAPLVGQAMAASTGFRELTPAILMRGLRAAGLGGHAARLDKDGREVTESTQPTLAADIARSANGRGYEVLVDLPYGRTAGDAAEKVEQLASGLDVDVSQVFPEPVQGSARRVALYVADEDPMLLPPHRSPLARFPKVSVWDPQPVAQTPVGREVRAPLLFSSYLVGAVPRAGKSFAAKCLVAPAVLDPFCDITALDCKGGRDWLPAEQVAVDYRAGDDEDDLAVVLAILERRRNEARERLASFRKLTDAQMPEDKLTRELAAEGMHPHVIIVDEIQNLLRAPNKKIQKAALEVLTWLAKTAPAAGYSLIAITQRPAADVIPADLRDITTVRIALRTKTRQASDAILGSDISATGYRTDRFMENHKGAAVIGGIPTGKGGDLQVVRTDLLMPAEFAKACAIGRQRREDAGTLRGQAAGQAEPVTITVTVVDDVASVWPGDEAKVQAHVIAARLREVYGGRYAGLDETALTRALKAHDVVSIQVFRDGSNRNGYALADLNRARRALEASDSDA